MANDSNNGGIEKLPLRRGPPLVNPRQRAAVIASLLADDPGANRAGKAVLDSQESELSRANRIRIAQGRQAADRDKQQRRFAFDEEQKRLDREAAAGRAAVLAGAKSAQVPLSSPERRELAEGMDALGKLQNSLNAFQDDYAEAFITATGKLQNWATRTFGQLGEAIGFSDRPQERWWRNYRGNIEQLERHALFGASLTDNERADYEATAINEGMSGPEIRENLRKRMEFITRKLQSQAADIAADPRKRAATSQYLRGLTPEQRAATLGAPGEAGGTPASGVAGGDYVYDPATGTLRPAP